MLDTTNMRAIAAREACMRRALAKVGYRLTKCRRGYGGYGVIDSERNFIAFGLSADTRGYAASLDDIEEWVLASA